MKWLVVLSLATCSGALAQWPDDARIETKKLGPDAVNKRVVIVRKCEDVPAITEFTFEYPHLREKSAAARAVNRTIVESFGIGSELVDCPTPTRLPAAALRDSVSHGCQISSQHGSLLSLECHRGYYDSTVGRSGGYFYFLNFDTADGRQLEITDLIGTTTDFEKRVRAKVLEEYGDVMKDASEDFLEELVGNLAQSCGFTEAGMACSTVLGTNAHYDIGFPIAELCRELPAKYFRDRCPR